MANNNWRMMFEGQYYCVKTWQVFPDDLFNEFRLHLDGLTPKHNFLTEVTETEDAEEALPIVVPGDKSECPYCRSKRCLHIGGAKMLLPLASSGPPRRMYACRCRRFDRLFLRVDHWREIKSSRIICHVCTSPELTLTSRYRLVLRVGEEEIDEWYSELFTDTKLKLLTIIRCTQCYYLNESVQTFDRDGNWFERIVSTDGGRVGIPLHWHKYYYDAELLPDE